VRGDGHGTVLLHPGTAADGRRPELEFGARSVDRDAELRRLLHRHPRHRPGLGRTQPVRLPSQPHRLHTGPRSCRPDPEPHLAGQHPHARGDRLGADLRLRDPTHSRELPHTPRRRHLIRRVGFGIRVAGAIVLIPGSFADWRQLCLICAAVSAVFSVIAWTWPIPARIPPHTTTAEAADPTEIDAACSPAEAVTAFDAN